MPPLICCSPVILDQSFPRDTSELYSVADTLGRIQEQVNRDEIHLILTDELAELVENFDWNVREEYTILREIYRLLNQWFLQQHGRLIRVDLSGVQEYDKHPIPEGCEAQGLVDLWSDEVGKLLTKHDKCCPRNRFFIGIACESAYCTGKQRRYINPSGHRAFPLVGPCQISSLADAYDWQVPTDIMRQSVYIEDVTRHYKVIGSESLIRPSGGSHYKLMFKGGRSWVLDTNIDPVAEQYLSQLKSITGYELPVIKYALLNGELPSKVLRFAID